MKSESEEASAVPAADLGAATVIDIEGRERKLGEAWAERNALVVFIRHFG